MTTPTEREAFEAWAKSAHLDCDTLILDGWGQRKYHPHIESMWTGWQASRRAALKESADMLAADAQQVAVPQGRVIDSDWLHSVLRHADKCPDYFPDSDATLGAEDVDAIVAFFAAAPQPQQAEPRKPLTDAEIITICWDLYPHVFNLGDQYRDGLIARAIEQHHGIKEQK